MNYQESINNLPILKTIGLIADKNNIQVFVVGGFVRDLLLEKTCKDIDILCIGDGISFAQIVANQLHINKVSEFKNFGTAMIAYEDFQIEFVGARQESYQHNSRNPVVKSGTLDDDLSRRDFTINTIAISLNNKNFGTLIDKFNGINDLTSKILKTPLDPEKTFSDDPLRIMRAVRFANQLNLNIDDETKISIKTSAHRLKIVAPERISAELNKILMTPYPSIGFKIMDELGILEFVLPELVLLKGIESINGFSHKDNFYHTLQVVDNIAKKSNNLWLRWAALLHDIAKPQTKKFIPNIGFTFHSHEYLGAKMVPTIFKNLKLPLNQHMDYVQKLVKLHLRPIPLVNEIVTDSAVRRLVYDAGPDIDDLITLCRADITSKNEDKVQQYLNNFDKIEEKIKILDEKDKIRTLQPVITGEMVMQLFNIPPSSLVGEIKAKVKNAIIDGLIQNNIEECINFIQKIGPDFNLTISNKE